MVLSNNSQNSENHLVSVIMPAFNSEKFIFDSIKSAENQTYKCIEIIVINDASSDATQKIVESMALKDSRIKLYNFKEKSRFGAIDARNKALDIAKGRYIAFLDSDDLWDKNKIEEEITFLSQHKECGLVFSNYRILELSGAINHFSAPKKASYQSLLRRNYIGCLTVVYDRKIVGNIKFNEKAIKREDFALWLSILKNGICVLNVNKELATYRISENSVSRKKIKMIKWQWNLYKNVEKLGFVKSSFFLFTSSFSSLFKH